MTTTSHAPASAGVSATSAPCRSANAAACSALRLETTTRSIDGTAARIAASCDSACQPAPIRPRLAARAGEVLRRDAARRPGSRLAEAVGGDHRRQRAVGEVEQADHELHFVLYREVALEPGRPEPPVGGRHHCEGPAVDGEPPPGHELHLTCGHPSEGLLDHRHRLARRDQRADVLLGEPERHGTDARARTREAG